MLSCNAHGSFLFDRETPCYIYGCGGDGVKMAENLRERGHHVLGFIDIRAKEIKTFIGLPVLTLEEASSELSSNAIVIITLKNVFAHKEVAREIASSGLTNIIFKYVDSLVQALTSEQHILSSTYDTLLSGGDIECPKRMPILTSCHERIPDVLRIRDEHAADEIVAWVPIELVYNYHDHSAYDGLNMGAFFPLIDIYRCLLNDPSLVMENCFDWYVRYSAEFLNRKGITLTSELKDYLINSRIEVFSHMMKAVETNTQFFIRNAPLVRRIQGTNFHLASSGRNRISFLIARGYRMVPLRMKKNDYNVWMNQKCYKATLETIRDLQPEKVFAPIPHPKLITTPTIAETYLNLFVLPVARILIKEAANQSLLSTDNGQIVDRACFINKRKETSILCILNDGGLCSRYLASLGFYVNRAEEQLDQEATIVKALDSLALQSHITKVRLRENFFSNFTCLILDNRYPLPADSTKLLPKITDSIFYVDWRQQGSQHLSKSGFTLRQVLFRTTWNKTDVQGYFLKKDA